MAVALRRHVEINLQLLCRRYEEAQNRYDNAVNCTKWDFYCRESCWSHLLENWPIEEKSEKVAVFKPIFRVGRRKTGRRDDRINSLYWDDWSNEMRSYCEYLKCKAVSKRLLLLSKCDCAIVLFLMRSRWPLDHDRLSYCCWVMDCCKSRRRVIEWMPARTWWHYRSERRRRQPSETCIFIQLLLLLQEIESASERMEGGNVTQGFC